MQLNTVQAGVLTPVNNLIFSHTNAIRYYNSVTANYNQYSLYTIIADGYEVQIVQACVLNPDTLHITGNDNRILLFSLEGRFSFTVRNFRKLITINPYSYNILYNPEHFQMQCALKERKVYELCLISLPFELLNELTPTKYSQDFLQKILIHEAAVLFQKNIIAKKRLLNMVRELRTMQTKAGLLESSKGLALATIKEDEASETERRIYFVSAFIDDYFLDKDLTLETIAGEMKEDVSFIKKHFSEVMNKTVHQYIIEKKIGIAKILLATPKKIDEIARIVRMDESNLYRAFMKIHGISPKTFRKNIK